jgi:hypothetical protein
MIHNEADATDATRRLADARQLLVDYQLPVDFQRPACFTDAKSI